MWSITLNENSIQWTIQNKWNEELKMALTSVIQFYRTMNGQVASVSDFELFSENAWKILPSKLWYFHLHIFTTHVHLLLKEKLNSVAYKNKWWDLNDVMRFKLYFKCYIFQFHVMQWKGNSFIYSSIHSNG